MAEINSLQVTLGALSGGAQVTLPAWTATPGTFDMGTEKFMVAETQAIGTSEEAITIGDITAPAGAIAIRNIDATNYVDLSTGTGAGFAAATFCRLYPGQATLFYPTIAGAVNAKANTAAVTVFKTAVSARA